MISSILVGVIFALSFFAGLPPSLFWQIQIVGNFLAIILLANLALAFIALLTIRRRPLLKAITIAGASFFLWFLGERIPDAIMPGPEMKRIGEGDLPAGPAPVSATILIAEVEHPEDLVLTEILASNGRVDLVLVRGAQVGPLPSNDWNVLGVTSVRDPEGRVLTVLSKWRALDTIAELGPDLPPAFVAKLALGPAEDNEGSAEIWFAAFLTEPDSDNESVYRNRLIARRVAMQFRHDTSPALVVAEMRGNALSPRVRDFMRAGYLTRLAPTGWWNAIDPFALMGEDLSSFQRGITLIEVSQFRGAWGQVTKLSFTFGGGMATSFE